MKNVKNIGMALTLSAIFVFAYAANTSAQTTPGSSTTTKTSTQTTPDKGTPTNTTTTKSTTTAKSTTKTVDKVVGKDAKGRDIYQGPKGGKYIINEKGAKVYLPAEKKTTPAPTPTK